MRFSTKLTILILPIVITIGLCVTFFVYSSSLKTLEKEIKKRLEDMAFYVMDTVERSLYERYSDIQMMATDPIISSRNSTPKQITERLIEYRNTYKTYTSISFFDLNRVRIADTAGLRINKQHPMTKYWEDVLQGKISAASDIRIAYRELKKPIIYFASLVKDEERKAFGVVVARMPIIKLHEITKEPVGIYGKGETPEIDLIDKTGLLLYSNRNRKGVLRDNLSAWEVVKRAKVEKKGSLVYPDPYDQRESIFVFVREQGYLNFKGNGWILLIHIPTKVAFAPAIELRNKTIAIVTLISFLAIIVVLIISPLFTKPIAKLRDAAIEIGKGKLDTIIDIKSSDEIGELAEVFSQMIGNLQKITVSKDYLENIFKNITDSLIVTDADGVIKTVNPITLSLLGYKKDELLNQPIRMIFDEELLFKEIGLFELIKSGFIRNVEKAYLRKDGRKIPVLFSGSVMRDDNGSIQGIVYVAHDIRDIKQAEEKLNQKTKLVQLLQEIAVTANEALTVDEAMQICLDKVCSYAGWPVGHVYMPNSTGKLISTQLWHLENPQLFESFRKVTEITSFDPGVGLPGKALANGKLIWIADVTKSSNFPRGKLVKDIGVKAGLAFPVLEGKKVAAILEFFFEESKKPDESLLDAISNLATQLGRVTERKRMQRALKINYDELAIRIKELKEVQNQVEKSAIEAKNANRAKSEFLANMSHELRTPLNGILGLADVLLHSVKEEEHRKKLGRIMSSGEMLLYLVNDILDLSRIEEGKLSLAKKNFNLHELVERTAEQHNLLAQEKGLELKFSVDKDVPVHLLGDPRRLKQIITNLLGNSIKFTEDGVVAFECGLWDEECGLEYLVEKQYDMCMLHFSIRDTGIGIPKGKHDIIFERFAQSDSSTTRLFAGSGLGTTISRELVEMMGGWMWLESEVDKGSIFHFTARFGIVKDPASVPSAPVKAQPLATVGSALSVLLVEDNPVNQEVALSGLELLGHHVDLAQNGKEGVEKWRKGAFDLILMDIQMPEMDGFKATGIIRNLENKTQDSKDETGRPKLLTRIPILAMTAHAMAGDREKCLRAGMDDYISKPITLDRLCARISRITGTQTAGALSEKKEVKPEFREENGPDYDLTNIRVLLNNDEIKVKKLLQKFIKTTGNNISGLEKAIGTNDLAKIQIFAHTIKGAAAQIYATLLRQIAFDLEVMGKENKLEGTAGKLTHLEKVFNQLKEKILNRELTGKQQIVSSSSSRQS